MAAAQVHKSLLQRTVKLPCSAVRVAKSARLCLVVVAHSRVSQWLEPSRAGRSRRSCGKVCKTRSDAPQQQELSSLLLMVELRSHHTYGLRQGPKALQKTIQSWCWLNSFGVPHAVPFISTNAVSWGIPHRHSSMNRLIKSLQEIASHLTSTLPCKFLLRQSHKTYLSCRVVGLGRGSSIAP